PRKDGKTLGRERRDRQVVAAAQGVSPSRLSLTGPLGCVVAPVPGAVSAGEGAAVRGDDGARAASGWVAVAGGLRVSGAGLAGLAGTDASNDGGGDAGRDGSSGGRSNVSTSSGKLRGLVCLSIFAPCRSSFSTSPICIMVRCLRMGPRNSSIEGGFSLRRSSIFATCQPMSVWNGFDTPLVGVSRITFANSTVASSSVM